MTDEAEKPKEVVFHYIKSNMFRVIHVDGAWGGLTPRGGIQVAFFSERQPIPTQTTHPIGELGILGTDIRDRRIARNGMVRELEVAATMDLATAKSLRKWLDEYIGKLEELVEGAEGTTK